MQNSSCLSLRGPNGAAAIRFPWKKGRIPTENAAQGRHFLRNDRAYRILQRGGAFPRGVFQSSPMTIRLSSARSSSTASRGGFRTLRVSPLFLYPIMI